MRPGPSVSDTPAPTPRGVSFRALVAGALIAALLGVAAPYENLIISGSPLHFDYSTPAAVFFFFLFVVLVNPLLGLLGRRLRFDAAELVVVYVMAAVACTLPTNGLVCALLPNISAGTYYATPENGWTDQILPFIPDWMRVTDANAIKWFYEGLPRGQAVPVAAWVTPLLAWAPLLLALYGSATAMMVLVRRQWIEHERLTFPLVQVPIAMISDEEEGAHGRFFRTPAVWIGVLIPFLQYSLRALHNYYPAVPEGIAIWQYYYFWDGKFRLRLSLSYAVMGFGYLLSTKLGFSLWFLGFLTSLEHAVLLHYGVPGTQRVANSALGSSNLSYQGFGALMVLVVSSVWVARRHLYDIWRKVWLDAADVGDSREILSYRQAALILLVSGAVMTLWLHLAGMDWWLAPLFLTLVFAAMFGLTRVVAEGGLSVTMAPLDPADAVIGAVGAGALGHANLASLGMASSWAGGMRVTLMSAVIHGLRLAEQYVTHHRRRLFWAILLAAVVTIGAAVTTVLVLGYRHGALNLSFWFFGESPATGPYAFAAFHLANPRAIAGEFLGVAGLGGAVQLLLIMASKRWLWWPIHPIAFPVSAMWTAHHLMPSIFLAWLIKTVVLRYGGVRWYRGTRPFFLGLILGHYVTGGLWIVIDGFTGMTGNHLFFW
ncbi:MAG: DUF6785 family protein [Gemmatimonadota bacterium]